MHKFALPAVAIALACAILGVVAIKLAPTLKPAAETRLTTQYCDPGRTTCSAVLPSGGRLTLAFVPGPVRPLQAFTVTVTVEDPAVDGVEIDFAGTEMEMGYNRTRLTGSGQRFTAQALLPVCVTGTMEWEATLVLSRRAQHLAVPFRFSVAAR